MSRVSLRSSAHSTRASSRRRLRPPHVRAERRVNSARAAASAVNPTPFQAPGQSLPVFAPAQASALNTETGRVAFEHFEGFRPLLDLFPPTPAEPGLPDPGVGTATAPRLPPGRGVAFPQSDRPSPASPTYETFYGLTEPPFGASTDPKFLYTSTSHERAAQRLLTAIRRHDGFVLVTGAPGVGKTIACRTVIEQIDRRTLTSLLTDAFGSIEDLLQTMLVDFGVISRDDLARVPAAHDALVATLRSFLASLAAVRATALVIIDPAEQLPVEVLRQLPHLAGPDGKSGLLQIVLVGQPSLLSLLRRRELRDLDRCFNVRCAIDPLSPPEVRGYVAQRLSAASNGSRVEFDESATLRLHQLAAGVPRGINVVCERALKLGCVRSASVIDAHTVETAADELDLRPPVSRSKGVIRVVVRGCLLFALGLVGAAAALLTFREEAARVVVQWTQVPRAPGTPLRDLSTPLVPRPAPDDPATSVAQPR